VTSIVVTHDLESAFRITDRIALIHERRFSFVGSKEEARQSQDPVVKHFIAGEMETADG
jgi:phospholipid/cholesterol/gamma-HCH transport system ATP-binding protein